MATNATPRVPEQSAVELDWADFYGPLDPELVFECNSTVFGRYDSVCVYRHLIVIESPLESASGVEIPVGRIHGWRVDLGVDAALVTIGGDHEHVARVPLPFARALEAALRDVIGTDPVRLAA